MRMQNGNQGRPSVRNDRDVIRTGTPGPQVTQNNDRRIPDYINTDDSLVRISRQLSDGQIEIDFPTGDYVYRALCLMGERAEDSDGSTTVASEDGVKHFLKLSELYKKISRIKLEADGNKIFDFESTNRITAYQNMFGWHTGVNSPGMFFGFGWPNQFREGAPVNDLFALGTGNINDLKMTVYTNETFDDATKLRCPVWYNPVRVPAGHVISRDVFRRPLSTVGDHVIDDIRIDRRVWRILITTDSGKAISKYEVKVGDVPWTSSTPDINLIESTVLQTPFGRSEAAVGPYRTSAGALGSSVGAAIDLKVDIQREGLSLAPLISDAQRRRDDRIEILLTTVTEDTDVTIEVYYADRI